MNIGTRSKRQFTDPINLRLTEPLLEQLQRQALENERTLSAHIRFLLQLAMREETERRAHRKNSAYA
ncbi:MAG: hypothetical protein WBG50_06765 [Desulfomonilaceae bacterium]